jgi:hypothetical protein
MVVWIILVAVLVVLYGIYEHSSRRARALQRQRTTEFENRAKELVTRPADIAVQIVSKHIPTLVDKAKPYVGRDAYGVLTISPDFDGEIRYFVERVILADPAYMRAARAAIDVDADARARLLDSSATIERLVRNAIVKCWQDEELLSNWPAREICGPSLTEAGCAFVLAALPRQCRNQTKPLQHGFRAPLKPTC